MRKLLAATLLTVGLVTGSATGVAVAQTDESAEEDDGNNNYGLLGLVGLVGLAGLAGLKRRNDTHVDTRRDGGVTSTR